MPKYYTLLAFCLLSSSALAAEQAKLRTLNGKVVEGELIGVSEKKIDFRGKDGPVSMPFIEILDVDLGHAPAANGGSKYIDVALNDGSVLHCSQVVIKKNEIELKLAIGQEVKLPLASIAWMLNEAQDPAVREEWQKLLAKQGNHDLLAVKKGATVNALDGTLLQGDEKGEKIDFERNGKTYPLSLSGIHGMSFFRRNESVDDPLCKVSDTGKNLLFARSITSNGANYTVTTMTGAKIEYTKQMLARLDFSKGKLTFLSDLEPIKVQESSSLEGIDHYRRDKNLDGGPIKVKGVAYSKGLALHAYTELVYDIGGNYKDFKAVLGVDDQVGGDSRVFVVIEGDDRELKSVEVSRKDKKPIDLAVNVKNVKQLKIIVRSANILDLGDHVDLADAKVSK